MGIYTPSQKILEKYADVLVNFALGGGKGIKKGDVVRVVCPETARPLYVEIIKAITKAGGHYLPAYLVDDTGRYNIAKDFYSLATEGQLKFFPKKYMRGLIDEIDHQIYITGRSDPNYLRGVDPKKIMTAESSYGKLRDWWKEKENKGKFTWTIGLYGTLGMAKEAKMTEREYWGQITKACFLNKKDPIKEWKRVSREIERIQRKLTNLKIDKVHVEGNDVNLWVKIGEKRRWASGVGANIPSFEIFTSPDWRGTNGWISFNQPLYAFGNIIKNISLKFKNGKVVEAKAKKGQKVLREMISVKNADKIGEFSLTDKRFSKITKFMAETLYDENAGGRYGNTHIALGSSYHECCTGNIAKLKASDWKKLGFNKSTVHKDMISTTDRTVTAYLKNGKKKVIYRNGSFTI